MVRVLHLINDLSAGGAEMMLYKLLSCADRERFEPAVISLIGGGSLEARIEALGVPVYTVGMEPGRPTPAAIWRLRRLARRLKPDLIQGWMYHGNLAASLAAAFAPKSVPVLWNIRRANCYLEHDKPLTRIVIKWGGRLSGLPAKILYNSRVGAAQHNDFGYRADKTLVIPNGFDTALFAPSEVARSNVRLELGVDEEAILIGLVGRYAPEKDHANFLRGGALLLKSYPDVSFILLGRGCDEENRALGKLIRDLGIDERVYLLGERHDIPRITAALDIACSSSFEEGFSNVVGEAMACGVPCVVTDVGDSAWIVGETGRVVPPRDSEALCAAWQELVEMGSAARRELGVKARRRIEERFSIYTIAQQYERAYEEQLHGT
ncbi:MAG TPA: glycosyltransferase [Rubrobacteraceae bacterium]|nr:glycosyltransferase [Rubrobacteraceae bacterium]